MKLTQMKIKTAPFLLALFCILIIIISIHSHKMTEDMEKNGKTTIGKYVLRKWENGDPGENINYFVYYVNGKKFREGAGDVASNFSENIRKFYKIKYLENNKEIIQVQFNQEVTDTIQMREAGFSRDEILNIPSCSHFFPDSK